MPTVSSIAVTPGSGKIVATYSFTDSDSVIKQLQRIVQSDTNGNAVNVPTATPVFGQVVIVTTNTAIQLGSNVLANGVVITAKSTNVADITVGGSGVTNVANGSGNGDILEPGSGRSFVVNNTNVLYINGTSGDVISFSGS